MLSVLAILAGLTSTAIRTALALQPVVLQRHVLAFNIAGFIEALAERSAKGRIG
jgi:hypothetical protein